MAGPLPRVADPRLPQIPTQTRRATNPNNYNYNVSSAVSTNTRNAINWIITNRINSSPLDPVATASNVDHTILENSYTGSFCGESWADLYGYTFCDFLYQGGWRCGRHTTRFDLNDMADTPTLSGVRLFVMSSGTCTA